MQGLASHWGYSELVKVYISSCWILYVDIAVKKINTERKLTDFFGSHYESCLTCMSFIFHFVGVSLYFVGVIHGHFAGAGHMTSWSGDFCCAVNFVTLVGVRFETLGICSWSREVLPIGDKLNEL